MEFQGSSDDEFKKLPSFRKWCANQRAKKEFPLYLVSILWLPNEFPSISFDTEVFRLRVPETASIYAPILDHVQLWEDAETCLAIRVCSAEGATYALSVLETENCVWEDLGRFGRRLTVKERLTSKKPPTSKTRIKATSESTQIPEAPRTPLEGLHPPLLEIHPED